MKTIIQYNVNDENRFTINGDLVGALLCSVGLPNLVMSILRPSSPADWTARNVAMAVTAIADHYSSIPPITSAEAVADLVWRLDVVDKLRLGFFYEVELQRACRFLLPRALPETATVYELSRLVIAWRKNRQWFGCRMLGVALYMIIWHRLLRMNDTPLTRSQAPLIDIFECCPPANLPHAIMAFWFENAEVGV